MTFNISFSFDFIIVQNALSDLLTKLWKLVNKIYGFFLPSVSYSLNTKNIYICDIFDLNYHSPSVSLLGFTVTWDGLWEK